MRLWLFFPGFLRRGQENDLRRNSSGRGPAPRNPCFSRLFRSIEDLHSSGLQTPLCAGPQVSRRGFGPETYGQASGKVGRPCHNLVLSCEDCGKLFLARSLLASLAVTTPPVATRPKTTESHPSPVPLPSCSTALAQRAAPDISLPREDAPVSLFFAAMYTSGQTLEKPRSRPAVSQLVPRAKCLSRRQPRPAYQSVVRICGVDRAFAASQNASPDRYPGKRFGDFRRCSRST